MLMAMQTFSVLLAMLAAFASPQAPGIQRVGWLQGCWEMASGDRTVEEQWTAPRGQSMFSVGRTVRGDRLVDYEFVLLREQGERLAYEAHPAGQTSAVFLSTTISASAVVFENLTHDFPQRIGYERKNPDSLLAWIEGSQGGATRRIEFPYHRVACVNSSDR